MQSLEKVLVKLAKQNLGRARHDRVGTEGKLLAITYKDFSQLCLFPQTCSTYLSFFFSGAARVVQPQPVPVAAGEARALRGDRADDDAGLQLVQEPAAEGPRLRGNRVRKTETIIAV